MRYLLVLFLSEVASVPADYVSCNRHPLAVFYSRWFKWFVSSLVKSHMHCKAFFRLHALTFWRTHSFLHTLWLMAVDIQFSVGSSPRRKEKRPSSLPLCGDETDICLCESSVMIEFVKFFLTNLSSVNCANLSLSALLLSLTCAQWICLQPQEMNVQQNVARCATLMTHIWLQELIWVWVKRICRGERHIMSCVLSDHYLKVGSPKTKQASLSLWYI